MFGQILAALVGGSVKTDKQGKATVTVKEHPASCVSTWLAGPVTFALLTWGF